MDYETLKDSVFTTLARMLECNDAFRVHYTTRMYNIYNILSNAKKVQEKQKIQPK